MAQTNKRGRHDIRSKLRPGDKLRDSSILSHKMRKDNYTTYNNHLIAVFAICLLCIIIYSNTLNSPFVFDDNYNITNNSNIRLTSLNSQKLYDAGLKSQSPVAPCPTSALPSTIILGHMMLQAITSSTSLFTSLTESLFTFYP